MKFFLKFFDHVVYRPSHKFATNLFFLKNNFYFNFKNLLFISFFINISKKLNIKILKFSYLFYKNFILYFLLLNIFFQLFLLMIVL